MKLMIDDLASTLPSKEKDELAHEFRHFVLSLETEPKRKKFYKLIADGKTKKEALGLTTFFMSSLFQSAVGFFDQQKYQEAIVSFIALTWLDETNYVYPLFLGFSYFREQKYYEALAAYMTSAPNAPDMSPLLYMAQCFLSLGQLDQAQLCAEAGLKEEKLSEHPNREILSLFETILISTKVSV